MMAATAGVPLTKRISHTQVAGRTDVDVASDAGQGDLRPLNQCSMTWEHAATAKGD